ncbi:MAG: lytic transglycosylase domain-containing protein, partial [Candidatus Adiutrix sp.]|jgi:soluble lytic murein transglycosylase-like protein|nr:lytic transglycosylase domain-containing protein [Candidatus Adiutrix sp.]
LTAYEHRISFGQFVADFFRPSAYAVAALPANYDDLSPQAKDTARRLAFLNPDPELLQKLNDRSRARPAFSRASQDYEDMIADAAREHRVSPVLVMAVIQAESSFNPGAVSHRGAVGLMQVMPTTARMVGVHDPHVPQRTIVAGVKYLKMLLEIFNDDERLAIAAYNCGPEALRRYNNQVPPYRETRAFVEKVMNYYNQHLES